MQYLNKNHSTAFAQISEQDISVAIDGYSIHVSIGVLPAFIPLLTEQKCEQGLTDFLGDCFVQPADVSLVEKYVKSGETEAALVAEVFEKESFIKNARLVNVKVLGDPVFGKGNLNEYPIYIKDLCDTMKNAVFCGTVKTVKDVSIKTKTLV